MTPALALWTLGGLEPVVVAGFLGLGLLGLLTPGGSDLRTRNMIGAGAAFGVAVLTRLDASIVVAATGLGVLLGARRPFPRRFLAAAIVVGLPAAIAFAHMGWRMSY